jgi:hypothetical protein
MTPGQERRKHARSAQTAGYVSRYAQQRVDKRVIEIMSRRDAAERHDSSLDQALPARRPPRHLQTPERPRKLDS